MSGLGGRPSGKSKASRRSFGAFLRDTSANATIEFVIIAPVLFYYLFSLGEAGTLMARAVMLERGLDIAIRDVRLGITPGVTHDDIKQQVCDAAFLLGDCEDVLLLEMTPLDSSYDFPPGPVSCIDRESEIAPVISFDPTPGEENQIMFVRACLIVDPVFPTSGLGAKLPKDRTGGYAIIAQSAFLNEPGTN